MTYDEISFLYDTDFSHESAEISSLTTQLADSILVNIVAEVVLPIPHLLLHSTLFIPLFHHLHTHTNNLLLMSIQQSL